MDKSRSSLMIVSLVVAGVVILGAPEVGLASEEYAPPAIRDAYDNQPLLKTFNVRYEAIIQGVEGESLPKEVGEQALDLWTSLQHYLVDSNASIHALRQEIKVSKGGEQEKSLDRLVDASGERERTLMAYLQRLESLAEEKGCLLPLPGTTEEPEGLDGSSGSIRGAEDRIKIEFKAEDLKKTEME